MKWYNLLPKMNKAWLFEQYILTRSTELVRLPVATDNHHWKTVLRCGRWRIDIRVGGMARIRDIQTGQELLTEEASLYFSIKAFLRAMDGYCGTRKTGIGLVLSGGGAKGAYEIGVWQALRDVGLDKHITGVSGTSIGAINSLLFAAGDVETAKTLWTDMSSSESRRISRTEIAVFSREYARRREKNPLLSPYYDWEEDIFVSQPELNRHISRYAHGNGTALREKYRVFSTITPKEEFWPRASELVNHQVPADEGKENPHYVSWATLSAHEIVQLVLASSAHPLAYEPVRFRGREWLDGGLFDNTPVRPLYDCGYRNFIIVWLSRAPTPLRMPEKTERCRIVHFLPGPDFDDSLFATFTIDADLSRQRIEAGYQDALRQIGSQLALIRKMVNSA